MNDQWCDVFWGSHGCDLPIGHEGLHICRACCNDAPDHRAAHLASKVNHVGVVRGCAGMWPYYGKDTRFFRLPSVGPHQGLPDELARMKRIVKENRQSERKT